MPTAHYPRLYQLSTLNLIYHGSFDYALNPWCTSFAGESGVGKSMIADLLQLIFVGSKDEYKSATQAQGERSPEGLVLPMPGSEAKGLGYAFVTIEVSEGKFIVIGCYLAAAAGTVTPFIIQEDFDFSGQLTPLSRPLGYRDLLPASGFVLPLLDMEEHLKRQQQVKIRFFHHKVKDYHTILYRNHILPLDVTQPGVLRHYAKIIRSFSRSGDLNQYKSPDDLKNFLFDDEAKNRIWQDYQKRVAELSQHLDEHQLNRGLIADLTTKLHRFRSLHEKHREAQDAHHTWLNDHLCFCQEQVLRAQMQEVEAQKSALDGQTHALQLNHLQSQCQMDTAEETLRDFYKAVELHQELITQVGLHRKQEEKWVAIQQELEASLADARTHQAGVKQVEEWLKSYGDLDSLSKAQVKHQQLRVERALLAQLDAQLLSDDLTQAFAESSWATAPSASAAERSLTILREEVAASKRKYVFTTLDNPDSLANWALTRGKALSQEEESILTHFARFAHLRETEVEPAHYLHDPEELFAQPLQLIPSGHTPGGWLPVRGIRIWIPLLPAVDCAFGDADKARITKLFAQRHLAAQRDLDQLHAQLQREEAVYDSLQRIPSWQQALAVAKRRDALLIEEVLLPEPESFSAVVMRFQGPPEVHERHQSIIAQDKVVSEQLQRVRIDLGIVQDRLRTAGPTPDLNQEPKLVKQVDEARLAAQGSEESLTTWLRTHHLPADGLPLSSEQLAELALTPLDLGVAIGEQKEHVKKLSEEVVRAQHQVTECEKALSKAKVAYVDEFHQPVPDAITPLPLEPTPEPSPDIWGDLNTIYVREFYNLIEAYLTPAHAKRLLPEDGVGPLMREALPDVVHQAVASEEALRLVEQRLQSINDAQNQIAGLKIQLLRTVFDQVRAAYDSYIIEAKRIKSYFLGKTAIISGGFRPKLDYSPSLAYPIDWISIFGRVLNDGAAGDANQAAQLSRTDSLEMLMRKAYESQGGTVSQARAEDLLNPKSYLDLSFTMKSAQGRVNKGSTGQTFMATALLNVARLSVIGGNNQRPGIRFIPVDEAHGLGSNYLALLNLAREASYQVISLSVQPMLDAASREHRVYFLGFDSDEPLNLHPMMLDMTQKLVPATSPPAIPRSLFDDASN